MAKRNFRFLAEIVVLIALVWWPAVGFAASDTLPSDTAQVDPALESDSSLAELPIDTILYEPTIDITAARRVSNPIDFEQQLHQSPTVALFKSMLVPGLGQLGNRRYTKAVLFAGLELWFLGETFHYGRQASEARQKYVNADNRSARLDWYYLYDNKRKNRNKYAWFAGLTIFISMFDAYVDAHLSGSPADSRNDKFSVDVLPGDHGGLSAQLAYRF